MVDRCPSNAPARCGVENMPLKPNIWGFAGCPLIMHRKPKTDLHVFDSTIPKRSKIKTFLSQSRCLRSCCSRCFGSGRFRDRGLVVAAKGKNMQKPQEMLRKSFAVLGLQNLSEVNKSSGKERGNPETGMGGL